MKKTVISKHQREHGRLDTALGDLVADYVQHARRFPGQYYAQWMLSQVSVRDLLQWSREQAVEPTEA